MSLFTENTYAQLPDRFYHRMPPTPVTNPTLVRYNVDLAEELGWNPALAQSPYGLSILSGNTYEQNSQPLAQVYAGHQFGRFSPQLGDGRALLLGEVIDQKGQRRDIQLKGSGPTPYSRNGDGRSALGPSLREYLISEAMFALGVPTTRSLAVIATGEKVWRHTQEPGGILTRVASSHIRVGTFQYFAARGDAEAVKILADYVITRHYPDATNAENPYLHLLAQVINRQAQLIAHWMTLGFIHGVMNTDNMTVSGETIDYGPCAFMDAFDPHKTFSSIDQHRRYAYSNQASIALWNLTRFAETLLPYFSPSEPEATSLAENHLSKFIPTYTQALQSGLCRKIGHPNTSDLAWDLAEDFLTLMATDQSDFTLTFRHLAAASLGDDSALLTHFKNTNTLQIWLKRWRSTLEPDLSTHLMRRTNPVIIPRNHRVEQAIQAAYQNDFLPFHSLHDALKTPFTIHENSLDLEAAPLPNEVVCSTFCGT